MTSNHLPQRVVCLQPSATLTLRDLGLLDRVVGCTRYCADVCPEVAVGSRIIVSDSWTAQSEEIAASKPDLVIASVPYQREAVEEILKAGVRFLGLAPRTLADIFGDIATIAGVMGVSDRGEQVIAEMQAAVEAVRAQCASAATRPRVFCEEWGKPVISSQPWVAELVELAGGVFIGEPGKTTTADEVAHAAPDVLIAAWCGAGDRVPRRSSSSNVHGTTCPRCARAECSASVTSCSIRRQPPCCKDFMPLHGPCILSASLAHPAS